MRGAWVEFGLSARALDHQRLRALARTADRDEAIPLLEQAVDLLAESSAQLEDTRALVELGAAPALTS